MLIEVIRRETAICFHGACWCSIGMRIRCAVVAIVSDEYGLMRPRLADGVRACAHSRMASSSFALKAATSACNCSFWHICVSLKHDDAQSQPSGRTARQHIHIRPGACTDARPLVGSKHVCVRAAVCTHEDRLHGFARAHSVRVCMFVRGVSHGDTGRCRHLHFKDRVPTRLLDHFEQLLGELLDPILVVAAPARQ